MTLAAPTNVAYAPDGAGREPHSLAFRWDAVTNATSYEVVLTSSSEVFSVVSTGNQAAFSELTANRHYVLTVRARHAGDQSEFSAAFDACTLMPIPPGLLLSPSPALSGGVVLTWDWSTLVMDETVPATAWLMRETTGVANVIHVDAAKTGAYLDSHGFGARYALDLVSANPAAPGGENRARGPFVDGVVVPASTAVSFATMPHEDLFKAARSGRWV